MQDMMGNMMGWGITWGPGIMLFMTIFWIAILVLVIVGIVYLVRNCKVVTEREQRLKKLLWIF